jgi:hypothetical protein
MPEIRPAGRKGSKVVRWDFPAAESTVANQIIMFQERSVAAMHEQGVTNRQIAKLLRLDRDTVNRHVRLLKPQNQPGAPPGDDAGISPSGHHPDCF